MLDRTTHISPRDVPGPTNTTDVGRDTISRITPYCSRIDCNASSPFTFGDLAKCFVPCFINDKIGQCHLALNGKNDGTQRGTGCYRSAYPADGASWSLSEFNPISDPSPCALQVCNTGILRINRTCPRFVYMDIGVPGLGDQFSKLLIQSIFALDAEGRRNKNLPLDSPSPLISATFITDWFLCTLLFLLPSNSDARHGLDKL